jgi:predicted RNA-binding Zn-ribbon protein involved in translation (DUF1610 family)
MRSGLRAYTTVSHAATGRPTVIDDYAPDEKACPYCAETIKAAAVKCKHCRSDLVPEQADSVAAPLVAPQAPGLAANLDAAKRAFRCPKCGSPIIDFQHRRFDYKAAIGGAVGGAIAGALLGGAADVVPIGAVVGLSDGKQLEFKCQSCGHSDLFRSALQQGQVTQTPSRPPGPSAASVLSGPQAQTQHLSSGNVLHFTTFGGQREGDYAITAPNGHVAERGTYVNGVVAGTVLTYHPDGQLRQRGQRVNGKPHGVRESFDEHGTLTSRIRFEHGKPVLEADETLRLHRFDAPVVHAFGRSVTTVAPKATGAFLVQRISSDAPIGWLLLIALPRRPEPKAMVNRRIQECLARAKAAVWPVSSDELFFRAGTSEGLLWDGHDVVQGSRIFGRDR